MSYLVSVVVPTKNRYKYLKELIKLVDSFGLVELELVIHDNSDDNSEILTYLKNYTNDNIKYYYTTDQLTMSTNADAAIRKAQGEYICYIGDDDGVCRNIVDCVKWMKDNNIDSARSASAVFYYNDETSSLTFRQPKNEAEILNPIKCLKRLLRKGLVLADGYIPMIYQAIVKKSLLDEIYNMGNTHFPGVVPDISGGICLSLKVQKFARIRIPVVINGLSSNAGGGVYIQRKSGILDLEEVLFITPRDRQEWDNRLPRIWCSSFVWTDAGIKALNYMGEERYIDSYLNVDYSYAWAYRYYKDIRRTIFKIHNNKFLLMFNVVAQILSRYYRAIINRILKFKSLYTPKGLKGIKECEEFITDRNCNIDFKTVKIVSKL